MLCMLADQHRRAAPRWPLPILLPLMLLSLIACAGYTLERHHYSVDVLLAYYITPAVFAGAFARLLPLATCTLTRSIVCAIVGGG